MSYFALTTSTTVPIRDLRIQAFSVPTETPEADSTLRWHQTSVVVTQVQAGEHWGLGYVYTEPAAAYLIRSMLCDPVLGSDALSPQLAWASMIRAVRDIGRPGLASSAIAAVDMAMWDLKAKLLDVPLCVLLGQVREALPVYGSGGFCNYSRRRLVEQLSHWVDDGIPRVKMKVGRHVDQDPGRVAAVRDALGPGVELMLDANGAYTPAEALAQAARFEQESGVGWFEEPVQAGDHEGLRLVRAGVPPGMLIAAGEHSYDLSDFKALTDAGAADVLQVDAGRCGGITELLRISAFAAAHHMPISLSGAPAAQLHPGLALDNILHAEYFHDHARIERLLFDGAFRPDHGLMHPDLARPGNGLELRDADAQRYIV